MSEEKPKSPIPPKGDFGPLVFIGLIIIILWFSMLVISLVTMASEGKIVRPMEILGLFGDAFGAVNALFSGLALLGAVYAILQQAQSLKIQQTELELQREEMALQRAELKRTSEALAHQSKVSQEQLALQRIEHELGMSPLFFVYQRSKLNGAETIWIENRGAEVSGLKIDPVVDGPIEAFPFKFSEQVKSDSGRDRWRFSMQRPQDCRWPVKLRFSFVDSSSKRITKIYALSSDDNLLSEMIPGHTD